MKLYSTYSVKIKHYNKIFKETVAIYRSAVDFLISVCLNEWDAITVIDAPLARMRCVELLCHGTKSNVPKYDFDRNFYKFPSYLRRGAIMESIGKVSSYMNNLANWKAEPVGKAPSKPKAGHVYPCLYKDNMYVQKDAYEAQIKVYIRNTWDWLTVSLRKTDVDYILRRCSERKRCAPTLMKRGHQWFLDFPFEEKVQLNNTDIHEQTAVAVDLGINSAATVSVMQSDGTILCRRFLTLRKEQDSLTHALNRIKKAQQNGNRKTPRLWAKAKGINKDIAVKTAQFIIDTAVLYSADVIVFEHLDRSGKLSGSKKQRLHHWKSQSVQRMVTDKAHRLAMRVSHICAWGTSKLAFDGSGYVLRGKNAGLKSYSVCQFQSGKIYNCDLSASYNIGSRYFVREIIKSVPVRVRLALEAKVPQAAKRSTCTLSTLISVNAELAALSPAGSLSLCSICSNVVPAL